MNEILLALVPIFLIIALGNILKRIDFPDVTFWDYADKFTYYVLFPSLLIFKLSNANLHGLDSFNVVFTALISISILALFLMFINKFMLLFEDSAFTSVFQGSTRFNTYVFLALISALYGDKGLIIAALIMTFAIPFLNFICVLIFAIYNENKKINFKSFLLSIIKNPLIIACFIGGGLNFFDIKLFSVLNETLELLSKAALPLGLLSVGVGLHLSSIKEVKLELFSALFLKLAILPPIMMFVAFQFGVNGLAFVVLIIFASMPTASSSYILAKQLGGDVKLMSAIITLQTIVSALSITVILTILESYLK